MDQQRSGSYLPTLDGMRGLASLCVVAHHLGQHLDLKHGFHHGYLAVPFFFVLSGFVIARSYERGLRSGTLTLAKFAEIRAIRLYPMILFGALTAAILTHDWLASLLAAIVVPILSASSLFPVNPPEWSLLLELMGNAAHAVIARRLTDFTLIGVICISLIIVTLDALNDHNVNVGWGGRTLLSGIWLFVCTYSIGIIIARLEARSKLPRVPLPASAVLVIFLMIMAWPSHPGTLTYTLRDLLSSVVMFPFLIVLGISSRSTARLDKLSRFLGELSYPLYIVHVPLITAVAAMLTHYRVSTTGRYEVAPIVFVGCVAVGWLALKGYDIPARHAIPNALRVRRNQPSAGHA